MSKSPTTETLKIPKDDILSTFCDGTFVAFVNGILFVFDNETLVYLILKY